MSTKRLKNIALNLKISEETKRKVEELAATENRTITNFLETVIDRLYEQSKKPKAK